MKTRREIWLKSFLGLLWVVCLFRAITQSIVHDEALTYGLYVNAPLGQIFHYFDANHHFLNTLLMKLSVSLFGVSEWSIRLPALAGAALYFAAVYRICIREFKSNFACAATVALLTLNPFVLDFMVAARGYGLALGFLMWALAILLGFVREPERSQPGELIQAGAALSLSVMANLVFLVPAATMLGIVWMLHRKTQPTPAVAVDPAPGKKKRLKKKRVRAALSGRDRALQAFWRCVALPAACGCALFFVVSPLSEAKAGDLYAGAQSIAESLRSLYDVSLAHGGALRQIAVTPAWRDAVSFGIVPAVLLGSLAIGIRRRDILLILTAGTAVASVIALLALHLAVNLLYPLDRTGIYFLPLAALVLAGLAEEAARTPPLKSVGMAAYALSVLLAIQFLLEFNTRKFLIWEYDADTQTILAELSRHIPNKQPGGIQISNSWQLEPSLNFYATKDNLSWLRPITRAPISPGADYYVLMPSDAGAMDALHLRPVYKGPNSGTILASRQR